MPSPTWMFHGSSRPAISNAAAATRRTRSSPVPVDTGVRGWLISVILRLLSGAVVAETGHLDVRHRDVRFRGRLLDGGGLLRCRLRFRRLGGHLDRLPGGGRA